MEYPFISLHLHFYIFIFLFFLSFTFYICVYVCCVGMCVYVVRCIDGRFYLFFPLRFI
jgi:hypothetical protein